MFDCCCLFASLFVHFVCLLNLFLIVCLSLCLFVCLTLWAFFGKNCFLTVNWLAFGGAINYGNQRSPI